MKFELNKTYRHINNTDVAFKIKSMSGINKLVYLSGTWYNIVNPKDHHAISEDEATVNLDDQNDWEEFELKESV